MVYAMVAAIALYLARGIGDMSFGTYGVTRTIREYHAQAWTLVAGVLLVVAVLNP